MAKYAYFPDGKHSTRNMIISTEPRLRIFYSSVEISDKLYKYLSKIGKKSDMSIGVYFIGDE